MLEIDGSHIEGGGQIIRSSLTLSAITGKPVKIFNIRANRPNPGLQMQHLTAAKAVRSICRGTLTGAELHSTELIFEPGEIFGGEYEFNIGTAGSTVLVAQTILPIALFGKKKSKFSIHGGTHVIRSPSYDYFEKVFIPAISKFGVNASSELIKSGYYPKGGGMIEVTLNPTELNGCSDWSSEAQPEVLIRVSNLPLSIAIREKKIFIQNGIERVRIEEEQALDPANSLLVWAGFRGTCGLGAKGKRSEQVAQEALEEFKTELEVDKHLADQLLIYGCLAKGKTSYRTGLVTDHLRTNADIVSKFTERKIEIEGNEVRII